jgi:predicted esterase
MVAGAFSQSLPTVKDWAGMTPAEKLVWGNFKVAWSGDSIRPEIRSQVEQLNQAALAAVAAGDRMASVKNVSHALTLLRGQDWTPQRAFSAAMTVDLDRAVVGPGENVKIHLGQTFALDEKLGALKVAISLQEGSAGLRARDTELKFVDVANSDWSRAPVDIEVTLPNMPCANCRIAVTIGDPPIRRAVPIRIVPGLADLNKRISAANERVAALEAKAKADSKADLAAALAPIQYRLSLVDQASFNEADAALGALESGANPWAAHRGDFRMAYRSAVDNTLQPYRLFIPSTYDGSKPYPLILALHGAGRDENFYFDVQDGQMKSFAEKRGYIVACPRGRDALSLYVGDGERDVLDVMASVSAFFKVDPARIYLAGHDMGGAAAWSIAIHRPGVFAAVAASAPAVFFLTPDDMASLKAVPQMVVQGDQDTQVPVKQTRLFTEAARKAGAQVKYLEISGAGHGDVVAPSLAEMFDWFDAHRGAGAV